MTIPKQICLVSKDFSHSPQFGFPPIWHPESLCFCIHLWLSCWKKNCLCIFFVRYSLPVWQMDCVLFQTITHLFLQKQVW